MPRLFSLQELTENAGKTFERFPLALISAALATWLSFYYFGEYGGLGRDPLLCAILAVVAFAGTQLVVEQSWIPRSKRWIAPGVMSVLIMFFFLFSDSMGETVFVMRWAQLLVAGLAALIVVPFAGQKDSLGCWWQAARLFESFVVAGIVSAIAFLGSATAIGLLQMLFDLHLGGEIYARTWCVCALFFAPILFLSGIPSAGSDPSLSRGYPRRLDVIIRSVFVPLSTGYLLIVYGYLLEIAVLREWPKGRLGYMIAGISVFGLFTRSALMPIEASLEGYSDLYYRWFPAALLPLLGLQFMAVWRRTSQYGWTENRVFLAMFAVGNIALAAHLLRAGRREFRVIPAALIVGALVTTGGPWSPYALSLRSQRRILTELLEKNGILKEGKVAPSGSAVSRDDGAAILGALQFIVARNGQASLRDMFAMDVSGKDVRPLAELMGVSSAIQSANSWFNLAPNSSMREPIPLAGYDYAWQFSFPDKRGFYTPVDLKRLTMNLERNSIAVQIGNERKTKDLASLFVDQSLCATEENVHELPLEPNRFTLKFPNSSVAIHLTRLSGDCAGKNVYVRTVSGFLLLKGGLAASERSR